MSEPTDAELDTIDMEARAVANQNPIGTPFAWRKAYLAAFARAVLAKWGTPAVAVKAMGYGGSTGVNDYLMSDGTVKAMRPAEVRWATQPTPQPTQAQAGAVPLTDEQMDAALRSAKKVHPGYVGWVTDQRREWGRAIERAHGIKGGQHGADT